MSKASKGGFTNTDGDDETSGSQSNSLNLGQPAASLTPEAMSQLGGSATTGVVGTPGPEIGIVAPPTELLVPGIEIGITAPATEDAAPADSAPGGDGTSSGEAGDSLAGLGTWESVEQLTVAEENDEVTNQKGGGASFDPRAAN